MEVCKKIDKEFGAYHSSTHTTLNPQHDVNKLMTHLMEKQVVQSTERRTPAFLDPTDVGLDKLYNTSWVRDTMERVELEDLESENSEERGIVDVNYELSDVI